MGIIKIATDATRGALGGQFLSVIEPPDMTGLMFSIGKEVKKNGRGKDSDVIANGSTVHVYPNQCLVLVDGGKIVDYCAEEGYYEVRNSSQPSLFNGDLGALVEDSYTRFSFGGSSPLAQRAYFVNLQEIPAMKFGTHSPINYYDSFYDAELFIKVYGTYSVRIADPLRFYQAVVSKGTTLFTEEQFGDLYLSEFMEALQTAIVQLAADGERISFLMSKSTLLSARVKEAVKDMWLEQRGIELLGVSIMSIAYEESSQRLINERNSVQMGRRKKTGRIRCDKCGFEPPPGGPIPRFCPQCGDPISDADYPEGR